MATGVSGIDEVNRELRRRLNEVGGEMTERFVTEVLIQTAARSAEYTPVDTSRLINSRWWVVRKAQDAWVGTMGYGIMDPSGQYLPKEGREHDPKAARDYALPVHDGPNKNWQKASASNKFLEKGLRDALAQDLQGIIERSFNI